MGILEMDFERILGVTFLLVVFTPSCCAQLFGMLIFAKYLPFEAQTACSFLGILYPNKALTKQERINICCDAPRMTVFLFNCRPLCFSKVEIFLKGGLDLLPSPSPSVKIQIMGWKVGLECKGKTLLGGVNKLLKTKSLLTSHNNVLPYYLKLTFPPII